MNTKDSAAVATPTTPSTPSATTGLDAIAVALVVLAGVIASQHVGKAPIAMPALQHEFNRTLAGLSWVMAVFPVVGLVCGLFAGILVQRAGDRRMLLLGLLVLGTASIAGTLLPSYGWLIATRIVEGFGFLLVVVSAPALLNRIVPPANRNVVFGLWSCTMGAGIAASMLLGPLVGSWHLLWLVDGALAIIVAAGVAAKVRTDKSASVKRTPVGKREIVSVLRSKPSRWLALAFGFYTLQFFAFISFLPSFLMQRAGLTLTQAGIAAAIIVAANVIGNFGAGICLQRGVRASALMAGTFLSLSVLGAIVFWSATPAKALLPLCFVFSAIAGILPSVCLAKAPGATPSPELAPLGLGLLIQGNYLGQVLGPLLLGMLMGSFGWASASMQIVFAGVMGMGIAYAYGRTQTSQ